MDDELQDSLKEDLGCDLFSDDTETAPEPPKKKRRVSPTQIAGHPIELISSGTDEVTSTSITFDVPSNSQDSEIEDVIHHKSSSRRYFDDPNENTDDDERSESTKPRPTPKNFKCFNCDGVGHIARNCPKDPILICFKCGEAGHSGYRCSNAICSFCLKNHPVHECHLLAPDKRTFTFCLRCGSTEHFLNQCEMPMAHRVARLQCFVCGEYGHLNCNHNAIPITKSINARKGRNRQKMNGPKRVQLCSNCGDNRHTVYFCKEMPMDKTMIAIGLSTAPHEPKICFQCLSPGHDARLCPLTIRQKRQRNLRKQRDSKYTYRSTGSPKKGKMKLSRSQTSPQKRKVQAEVQRKLHEMQRKWRAESMALIKDYGRRQKRIQKKAKGKGNRDKQLRKARKQFGKKMRLLQLEKGPIDFFD